MVRCEMQDCKYYLLLNDYNLYKPSLLANLVFEKTTLWGLVALTVVQTHKKTDNLKGNHKYLFVRSYTFDIHIVYSLQIFVR